MNPPFELEPTFGLLMTAVLGWWCLTTSKMLYGDFIKKRRRGDLVAAMLLLGAGISYFYAAALYFQELNQPTNTGSNSSAHSSLWKKSDHVTAEASLAFASQEPQLVNTPSFSCAAKGVCDLDNQGEKPFAGVGLAKQLVGQLGNALSSKAPSIPRFYFQRILPNVTPASLAGFDVGNTITGFDQGRVGWVFGQGNDTPNPPVNRISRVVDQSHLRAIPPNGGELNANLRHHRGFLNLYLAAHELRLFPEKIELFFGVLNLPPGLLNLGKSSEGKHERANGNYPLRVHVLTSTYNPNGSNTASWFTQTTNEGVRG